MDKNKVRNKLKGFVQGIGPKYAAERGPRFQKKIEILIETGALDPDEAYEMVSNLSAATVMSPDAIREKQTLHSASKGGKSHAEQYKRRDEAIKRRALA